MLENYEELVYAGLLGKVVGVYLGRPFEGWSKEKIEAKWRNIEGYVHEDVDMPLVVADDDISGTIAFARALTDSGLYEETPDDFFGKTWLNYLIENQTVLWWGGIGISTEHTAWLNLKNGILSPKSGSIKINGKTVSDQIGGQIFIEAFGLVAPNNPDLAVKLAEKAARVSHDGDGVYGALVVAALVSMAFTEKDMDVLLDKAVAYVPEDSDIAAVHKDVRAWCKIDDDWRVTYERIKEQYGYSKFGGGCHIIPNHALMVMAWCHAPDNFYKAQQIINTAGWDTDCNAANVGSVMGVKLGLEAINQDYDFQKPFADRIMIPTADGTDSFTDVLNAAGVIVDMGKKINKETIAGKKPVHHFSMPGALHGYQVENNDNVEVLNEEFAAGQRALAVTIKSSAAEPAIVSTPLLTRNFGLKGDYDVVGTSALVSGKRITMSIQAAYDQQGIVAVALLIRTFDQTTFKPTSIIKESAVTFNAGEEKVLEMIIPDLQGWPVYDMGFEVSSENGHGKIFIKSVEFSGQPNITFEPELNFRQKNDNVNACDGWISTMDGLRSQRGMSSGARYLSFRKNCASEAGFLVTGDRSWKGYTYSATLSPRVAPKSLGIVVNYQGLERYITFVYRNNRFELIERYYEDRLLGAIDKKWDIEQEQDFSIVTNKGKIEVFLNGESVLTSDTHTLNNGGVGFTCSGARALVTNVSVKSMAE